MVRRPPTETVGRTLTHHEDVERRDARFPILDEQVAAFVGRLFDGDTARVGVGEVTMYLPLASGPRFTNEDRGDLGKPAKRHERARVVLVLRVLRVAGPVLADR